MKSLLIANRGEIARRIMRTAQRMGLRTIAVYSDADRDALHVREADAARADRRRGAARVLSQYRGDHRGGASAAGADAVHPGYGFLAENADFAQAVIDAGLIWVGPPPAVIRQMGDKAEAKRIAREAGVPTIPAPRRTTRAMRLADARADRLSADDQGRGGRRRARHAAGRARERASTPRSMRRARRPSMRSATAGCCWNAR